LHPLVLINISDHFTREKVSGGGNTFPHVVGALLGTQSGRNIEIFNSFEMVYAISPSSSSLVEIDFVYLKTKQEQFKEVFPLYEFLGWYSTGSAPTEADLETHKTLLQMNESPLFLIVDPTVSHYISPGVSTTTTGGAQSREQQLPVYLFETSVHIVQEKPFLSFSALPYKIDTVPSERISIDHVANLAPTGAADQFSANKYLSNQASAIRMLSSRIEIVKQYLTAVQEGKIPVDHALLRDIASLCNNLPSPDTPQFKQDYLKQYNDVLLVTYLGSITKATGMLNDVVDKYNIAFEKSRRGGTL